jgi:hypothetical protein
VGRSRHHFRRGLTSGVRRAWPGYRIGCVPWWRGTPHPSTSGACRRRSRPFIAGRRCRWRSRPAPARRSPDTG